MLKPKVTENTGKTQTPKHKKKLLMRHRIEYLRYLKKWIWTHKTHTFQHMKWGTNTTSKEEKSNLIENIYYNLRVIVKHPEGHIIFFKCTRKYIIKQIKFNWMNEIKWNE